MTNSDINVKVTALTGAGTVAYPTANRLIDYNIWNEKIVSMILNSQDDSDFDDPNHGDFQIFSTDLTANRRDYGIPVSKNLVEFKRVEVTYDGVNWVQATRMDKSQFTFGISSDSKADEHFSKSAPVYDTEGLSAWVFPMASQADEDAGASINIWYSRGPEAVTDLSTGTPGFDAAFHPMLAYGMAYEYGLASGHAETQNWLNALKDYESRLRRQYGNKQKDGIINLTSPYNGIESYE